MKSFSLALSAHLNEGTTTLSWCWRITRADGEVLGFTDHDRAMIFGMVVTIASAGAISVWRPGIYAGLSCIDGRPVSASGGFEGGGVPTGYSSGERQGRNLIVYGSAAPIAGTWTVGDKVINTAPTAGGNIGWVCTTAGTPGTWKTFGAIAA